jgi:hypothetical protein
VEEVDEGELQEEEKKGVRESGHKMSWVQLYYNLQKEKGEERNKLVNGVRVRVRKHTCTSRSTLVPSVDAKSPRVTFGTVGTQFGSNCMKMHPVDNLVYHWYNYLIFKLDKDTWTDHCLVLSNNPSQCLVKRGSLMTVLPKESRSNSLVHSNGY